MKLIYQITLAFSSLLVIILGTSAVIIHFVLLDQLINVQKQELKTISSQVATTLQSKPATLVANTAPGYMTNLSHLQVEGIYSPSISDVQVIVSNVGNVGIINYGQPEEVLPAQSLELNQIEASLELQPIDYEVLQRLQSATDNQYIVDVNKLPEATLTLVSPMSKVTELEKTIFGRLLLVLGIGVLLAMLFSFFITRRLINPLMKLKEELKKVKNRNFSEVQRINARGEIGIVAQTAYELAGELGKYIQVQKHFFQNASHELKTPLMSISGYAEGIRDGIFEGNELRKGIDIILSESNRLKKIVSEMTLLAKLDSEADIFQSEAVNLKDILNDIVERTNPLLKGKHLELKWELDGQLSEQLCVQADHDKLLQAFLNVTANAIRHAEHLIVIQVQQLKKQLVITVTDDGNGIEDALLPHLFHRFIKGKNGENGLGLAISRAIVERCGGQIKADNQSQGGALFTFSFPAVNQ